jgi:hypothetical protein
MVIYGNAIMAANPNDSEAKITHQTNRCHHKEFCSWNYLWKSQKKLFGYSLVTIML